MSGPTISAVPTPDELRELLWEAINRYSANRADLNARSQAAARINELLDLLARTRHS